MPGLSRGQIEKDRKGQSQSQCGTKDESIFGSPVRHPKQTGNINLLSLPVTTHHHHQHDNNTNSSNNSSNDHIIKKEVNQKHLSTRSANPVQTQSNIK